MRRMIRGEVLQAEDGRAVPGVEVDIYEYQSNAEPSRGRFDQGELLGSVITNLDGVFTLEWDDIDMAQSGSVRARTSTGKSALVAAVFVTKEKARSTIQERKLLATTSPRQMARIVDSFVIRIPKNRIVRAGIKLPKPFTVSEQPSLSLEEEIEARLKLRSKRIDSLRKGTKKEIKRRIEVQKKGRNFAKNILGRAPRSGRKNSTLFVPVGEDSRKVLSQAMTTGLNRLGLGNPRGITLHKGTNLGKELEGIIDEAAKADGKIPPDIAEKVLESMRSGVKSTRVNDLLTKCRAASEASVALGLHDDSAGPDATDDTATTSAEASESTGEFSAEYKNALDQVLKLIKTRTDLAIGLRPDSDSIAKGLEEKYVPLGPADTTAFYDFYSLHVAWEDTWTAAIDSMTADEIAKLYESIVEVLDPEIVQELDMELQTVRVNSAADLAASVNIIADRIGTAKSTPGYEAPSELVSWIPQLGSVWLSLPADVQKLITGLHVIYQAATSMLAFPSPEAFAIELAVRGGKDSLPIGYIGEITVVVLTTGSSIYDNEELIQSETYFPRKKAALRTWVKKRAQRLISPYFNSENAESASGEKESGTIEIDTLPPSLGRAEQLIEGIKQRLAEPHKFDIFVPDSYNYGVLSTFRQRWQPLTYQVGSLVSSMPLAPGETRSFTKKKVIKTTRAQKELEKALSAYKNNSTTTGRAEADIINKATNDMNFSTSTSGSFSMAGMQFGGAAQVGGAHGAESAKTKKNIREAVRSAAQEYSDERTLEITSEREVTGESIEKGEISNPNNELTVTYLFYELQRRFEVSEKLHELTPVVMVAYDVPAPNEIDEDWLLTYAWILKRVILDDSFLKGLRYITESFTGDEVGVDVLYKQWVAQMEVVAQIRDNVSTLSTLRDQARNTLSRATEEVAGKDGLALNIHEVLHGSGAEEKDLIEARTESAQLGLEWANADFDTASSRLQAASQALRQATDDYLNSLKKQLNRRTAIDQVRIHVKDNILYYMQAIWRHEHRDQRYFRLYDLEIQWPEPESLTYTVSAITKPASPGSFKAVPKGGDYVFTTPPPKLGTTRRLHQVADLDQLLGFRGNYGIFPLSETNALTDYISQDFLDNYFGVVDPEPFGEILPRSEALELVECAWNKPGTTDDDRLELTRWLTDTLSAQKRVSEEIIVPTGQLYIEALPGTTPLLEDFKLKHRAVDVKAAESDLDMRLLEALRRLARLSENDLSDPDIDKNIQISGDDNDVIVDTE